MTINSQKLDKDLVAKLLTAFLDSKIQSNLNFWCLAGVQQAYLAAFNLRAIEPEILKTDSSSKWSVEAFTDKLPQSMEEFKNRLHYLIALDAAIHAYGKQVEEDYVEAVRTGENRFSSMEPGVNTFRRNPSKGEYAYKVGKGFFCLDIGDFIPEHKGEFIIGPFCSRDGKNGGIVTEGQIDSGGSSISEIEYAEFLRSIGNHKYRYEEGIRDYGDYQDVYGKPQLEVADMIQERLEDYGKRFMDYAGREIAKEREAIALARANGEFNDGEAGQRDTANKSNKSEDMER